MKAHDQNVLRFRYVALPTFCSIQKFARQRSLHNLVNKIQQIPPTWERNFVSRSGLWRVHDCARDAAFARFPAFVIQAKSRSRHLVGIRVEELSLSDFSAALARTALELDFDLLSPSLRD